MLLKCCCVRCCCPRAASCSCTPAGFNSVLRRAAGKNLAFFRAGYPALTPYFSAFCEIAPLQVVTQTCFCCVLEMQHVESGAVLQHCRRDELAAEMLKVLTKPFMVRSAHVLHHTLSSAIHVLLHLKSRCRIRFSAVATFHVTQLAGRSR